MKSKARKPGAPRKFYRIDGRPIAGWGDYGDILQHGMSAHLGRSLGRINLERTGPYMPPITFPGVGDVVLTATGRELLESSGLTGFTFRLVNKARIVSLAWEKWDLGAPEPPVYPKSGEPEDYILGRRHNPALAARLGVVWELVVPPTAVIGRTAETFSNRQPFRHRYLELASWNGADFVAGEALGSVLVTERAKLWLDQNFGQYMVCEDFSVR